MFIQLVYHALSYFLKVGVPSNTSLSKELVELREPLQNIQELICFHRKYFRYRNFFVEIVYCLVSVRRWHAKEYCPFSKVAAFFQVSNTNILLFIHYCYTILLNKINVLWKLTCPNYIPSM